MNKKNVIVACVFIVIFVLLFILLTYSQQKSVEINNTYNERTNDNFENNNYDWRNDGIELMQHAETGEYGCFGCNERICTDPVPQMQPVQESDSLYCTLDFDVVQQ